MTNTEIRQLIAEALVYAAVPRFSGTQRQADFLAGADIALAELDIDSLAAMELCIAIEANTGLSILPAELETVGSLNKLVSMVEGTDAA